MTDSLNQSPTASELQPRCYQVILPLVILRLRSNFQYTMKENINLCLDPKRLNLHVKMIIFLVFSKVFKCDS